MQLQLRLESKIRIISPAIDMIDLISARGNTTLESAVSLTKEIRFEIQRLGSRLNNAANDEALLRRKSSRAKDRAETESELRSIISAIKNLLLRIEDAVPLINLAITTSGVNLSTKLSGTISPSRLLQASTFLTAADSKYAAQPGKRAQVGPTWTLSVYMLFAGHAWRPVDEDGVRETTWKEVIHKARVKLVRLPLDRLYDLPGEWGDVANGMTDSIPADAQAAEYAYQLVIVEDLDDDRVHTFEDDEPHPGSFDDVASAGIRDIVPIHEVSKIFYADTGKILNIGGDSDTNSPVLLLRRDVHAEPPRRMLHRSQMENGDYYDESVLEENGLRDEQSEVDAQVHGESAANAPNGGSTIPISTSSAWRLPADLDPEWIAFEVYSEDPEYESDPEEPLDSSRPATNREASLDPSVTGALSNLNLRSPSPTPNGQLVPSQLQRPARVPSQIKTSLSLLEMLLKLTALQQFRQESHLAIEDELLNFFLEDSATAGAGPDKVYRQRMRQEAMRRVGFDPYDESPVKRRGEEYISHARGAASQDSHPVIPGSHPVKHEQWREHGIYQDQLPIGDGGYGDYDDDEYDDAQVSGRDAVKQSIERPLSPLGSALPSSRHGSPMPSSPSPRPQVIQRTSSRSSTPSSKVHRSAQQGKYAADARSNSLLATPPSTGTTKSRQVISEVQSEPKVRSPLAREVTSLERSEDGNNA